MEKPTPPRSRKPSSFGIKDLFTTINVLGGAIAICLCVAGRPFEAGISVMCGYFFGDALDGWVARKLGTANKFGSEYDTIADHLAHAIAPATILYTVYATLPLGLSPLGNHLLAGALASCVMVSASIRHARNVVFSVEWKGAWAGLPRSVLGFVAIGLANGRLTPMIPGGHWTAIVLIPLFSAATLTYIPYPNHRMHRAHYPYVKVLIALFFVTSLGGLALYPAYVFDILFFWMFGYAAGSWVALTPAERAEFAVAVREARARGA